MEDTAQLTRNTAHHGTAGDQKDSKRCNKQDVGPGAHGRFVVVRLGSRLSWYRRVSFAWH